MTIFFLFWLLTSFFHDFSEGQVQIFPAETPSSNPQKKSTVTGIRHWSSTTYTRIVIDLDMDTRYEYHLLKEDIELKKPPRLYIDLKTARLSTYYKQPILVDDALLKQVRLGQYKDDTVRVVLDLESIIDYRVFDLADPYRVVIDIMGKPLTMEDKEATRFTSPPKIPYIKVVVDPGHGGEDPGAIGPSGLKEKDVVLVIASKLKDLIIEKLRWEVVMTRQDDRFVDLEERTAIANKEGGNLFLSIHANACTNRVVYGMETYVLGTTNDDDVLRLAAKENRISTQKVSALQLILTDLKLNDPVKMNQSIALAECVQGAMTNRLQESYGYVRNLGVKRAPFVVLMGADMPSILIEVSFISNLMEEQRLRDSKYRDELASAILNGLNVYTTIDTMAYNQLLSSNSTAFNSH